MRSRPRPNSRCGCRPPVPQPARAPRRRPGRQHGTWPRGPMRGSGRRPPSTPPRPPARSFRRRHRVMAPTSRAERWSWRNGARTRPARSSSYRRGPLAQPHVERDSADAMLRSQARRKVTGAVGDDSYPGHGFPPNASLPVVTKFARRQGQTTSRWLRRQRAASSTARCASDRGFTASRSVTPESSATLGRSHS